MEATVRSLTNGSTTRQVVLSGNLYVPPSCCSYSTLRSGFPCYHGIAVLCEKHGSANVYKCVPERHHTSVWKSQYHNISYGIPRQSDIDSVFTAAKTMVAGRNDLKIPKAIAPPMGRLSKRTGKRKKGWFEMGPQQRKKRSYTCSLCHVSGHSSKECELGQLFD